MKCDQAAARFTEVFHGRIDGNVVAGAIGADDKVGESKVFDLGTAGFASADLVESLEVELEGVAMVGVHVLNNEVFGHGGNVMLGYFCRYHGIIERDAVPLKGSCWFLMNPVLNEADHVDPCQARASLGPTLYARSPCAACFIKQTSRLSGRELNLGKLRNCFDSLIVFLMNTWQSCRVHMNFQIILPPIHIRNQDYLKPQCKLILTQVEGQIEQRCVDTQNSRVSTLFIVNHLNSCIR